MAASVSARRQSLADLARTRPGKTSGSKFASRVAIAILLLCLLALAAMWLAGFFSTPAEILAVRAAVDTQILELDRVARGEIPFSDETVSLGPLMGVAQQVPERYRDQARQELGRYFEAREAAEINSYFAVSPAKRAAELDRRIKAEEAQRARREAERTQREAERGNAGGPATSQATPASRGQGRRGSGTEESRNAWVKRYIDRTSPDGRARRTEYRRAKDQRRIAMGLEPRR